MAYEPKPGDGTMWTNKEPKSDKSPAYFGHVIAHRDIKAGERVRLAAWLKGGVGGKDKFLSLKMEDETPREKAAPEDAPF